ncbi:uncharacterized protein PHACADRAFT_257357 [Phanerochaete carnosa HHB-10118-sp]|uniref:Uncharacterized protein n=1 Tax=Phanerochaete carnosa (strain HHB-10118-sp) TaxID=650164 RepID=K5W4L5_PHACS|nr:uncharacterized protein PHACADRAFT_257357 [Phanerochaete carnosa HHB-10118-sp]EKM53879.1 hypothetical protein PHACADRAFT_257357 [Phanerochaete carnosa HHB-10118-sp]
MSLVPERIGTLAALLEYLPCLESPAHVGLTPSCSNVPTRHYTKELPACTGRSLRRLSMPWLTVDVISRMQGLFSVVCTLHVSHGMCAVHHLHAHAVPLHVP